MRPSQQLPNDYPDASRIGISYCRLTVCQAPGPEHIVRSLEDLLIFHCALLVQWELAKASTLVLTLCSCEVSRVRGFGVAVAEPDRFINGTFTLSLV
jgi:hypothetical protein